jgi:predicted Fe-S protein YdhL (DUF1289 family)
MHSTTSPCTGVCTLNAENICVGCGRRLDEIAEWGRAFDVRKERIVELAAERMDEMTKAKTPASSS